MHGTIASSNGPLGASDEMPESQIEDEILSAIDEGEKEGIVDEQEREIIESAIEFGDTTAGQIMTTRHEISAIVSDAPWMK